MTIFVSLMKIQFPKNLEQSPVLKGTAQICKKIIKCRKKADFLVVCQVWNTDSVAFQVDARQSPLVQYLVSI